jgi:hypothetical protein
MTKGEHDVYKQYFCLQYLNNKKAFFDVLSGDEAS